MNAYESKWYCELKELPVSEIDVDVKAKSYQMHCGRCMSHRGLKPYSVNLCKDVNSLRLSVIYRDGRALYHVVRIIWESLYQKSNVLHDRNSNSSGMVIINLRKLEYYDYLISCYIGCKKKQWAACGLCQTSSSKSRQHIRILVLEFPSRIYSPVLFASFHFEVIKT